MHKRIRKTLRKIMRLAQQTPAAARRAWSWSVRTARDPQARDRAAAGSVFAAIFAFGLFSADYLITGGPDWNPGAVDLPRAEYAQFTAAPRVPENFVPPAAPEPEASAVFYNANISADDLLGAPVLVAAAEPEFRPVTLLQTRTAPLGSESASVRRMKPGALDS